MASITGAQVAFSTTRERMKRSVVVFGLLGGSALSALVLVLSRPGAPIQVSKRGEAPLTTESRQDTEAAGAWIQRLERRAAETSPAASTAAGAPEIVSARASSGPSPEEATQNVADLMKAREAQVAAEPDDPRWSRGAAAALRKNFEDLGIRSKFKVASLECRTTSCLAKLSWPSYDGAAKAWRSVLHAQTAINCARSVFVPPPEGDQGDREYEGTVYFDCTEARAE